jgi:hypothetical protein
MGTPRVALLMLDVDAHSNIEHAVLYEQNNGSLRSMVSSYEAGPFDALPNFTGWLYRALYALPRPPK